jgi:catechol 2,3-dioxygenase-like lactoylglutathione lyase family enzyme
MMASNWCWAAKGLSVRSRLVKTVPEFFGVGPVFPVHDVAKAVEFYRSKLGFDLDFVMGDPPDHGSVTRCRVGIQFTKAPEEFVASSFPGWTYIFVDNIDALHSEYVERGVTLTQPLKSHEHGMREFEIQDINGFRLRLGQYL